MTFPQYVTKNSVLVAIDVSKLRNDVLIEFPGKSRRRRLTVLNSRVEHDRFIEHLRGLGQPVTAGFEATGNYHRPIAWRLHQAAGGQFRGQVVTGSRSAAGTLLFLCPSLAERTCFPVP